MYIPRDCRRRQRAAHSDQDRQRVVLKQPKHDPGHAEQLRILRGIRFPIIDNCCDVVGRPIHLRNATGYPRWRVPGIRRAL